MARILIHAEDQVSDSWYEQIEPSTLAESEFEDMIVLHAQYVYPEFHVVPFKKTVDTVDPATGEAARVRPDLAFIDRNYREWWVVEVEMTYHGLSHHVLPQLEKLKGADYSNDVADYLAQQDHAMSVCQIRQLLRNSETRVLVIVNQMLPAWSEALQRIGVSLAVLEVFRGKDGRELLRANGDYPSTLYETVSDCDLHPQIRRLLGLSSPENLRLPQNRGSLSLIFNNCLTEWQRLDAVGRTWLQPLSRNPLSHRKSYQIVRRIDGTLVLRERIR